MTPAPAVHEQLSEVASVGAIGLRATVLAAQRSCLRRLGHVRRHARPHQLLDYIPLAGASLQREGNIVDAVEPLQPDMQPITIRRCELPP